MLRSGLWAAWPGLLLLGAVTLPAQEPKYPHVSLATTYEVDPRWPQKPD